MSEGLVCGVSGGAGGNRTRYLFNAIEALSQMSYSPTGPLTRRRERGYSLANEARNPQLPVACQNRGDQPETLLRRLLM